MARLEETGRQILDPRVPPDERWDINQELFHGFVRDVASSGTDIPPPAQIEEAVEWIQRDQERLALSQTLAKSTRLEGYQWWAGDVERQFGRKRRHNSILYVNDLGLIEAGPDSRYIEKPGMGGFAYLRQVIDSIDIIKAIILTRQRQLLAFFRPESDEGPLGYKIMRRDGDDMTDEYRRRARRAERFLNACGDEPDARKRKVLGRPNLMSFVKQHIWDSLAYDAAPIETELSWGGKLAGLYNVDGTSVRLCSEIGYDGDDSITAVQVVHDTPMVAFTWNDLIYEVRHPRADLRAAGYGLAEAEMVVRAITAWLNAFAYNASALDRSTLPRGVLTLFGEYGEREQRAFTDQWRSMLRGASSRHTMPTLFAKSEKGGANWIKIDDFDELHFARFISLVVSVCCAVWGIHPDEIHFDSFSSRNSNPLSPGDTASKLAHSRDKGLLPLVQFVEVEFNDYVMPLIDKALMLKLVGLEQENEQQKWERVKLTRTVDEIREIDGLDPHPNEIVGGAPANQALSGLYMQSLAQKRGEEHTGTAGRDAQGEQQGEDEDYARGEEGEHAPYHGEQGKPSEEHVHTVDLRVGEEGRESKGGGKQITKALADGLVVIERNVDPRQPPFRWQRIDEGHGYGEAT